jgi:hypothetical protein
MDRLAFLFLLAPVLVAAEDRLDAIHALLVPMRTAPIADGRGATAALTDVKHQLRDWIEFRLSDVQWKDGRWTPNSIVLQEQLNDGLSKADLFCPQNTACGQNPLGYLGRIAFEIQSGYLVVRTSIGIQICGTDDSAYIYESVGDRWRRIWQSEQGNYKEKTFSPQRLVDESHRMIGDRNPITPST